MLPYKTPYQLGKEGELFALNYLKKNNYKIIKKNLRTPFSEVDIVAIKDNSLIFIEVKTRSSNKFGTPFESITKNKIERLKKAIIYYSSKNPSLPKKLRIEVLSLEISNNIFIPRIIKYY